MKRFVAAFYDGRDHDALIEHAVHFWLSDVSGSLNEPENRWAGPGAAVQDDFAVFWQDARDVVGEAAAGDVGVGRENDAAGAQAFNGSDPNRCGDQKRIGQPGFKRMVVDRE